MEQFTELMALVRSTAAFCLLESATVTLSDNGMLSFVTEDSPSEADTADRLLVEKVLHKNNCQTQLGSLGQAIFSKKYLITNLWSYIVVLLH